MFQHLNSLLDNVGEVDNYWSNFGIADAVAVVEQFSDADWQQLQDGLSEKSDLWLRSCAEVMGDVFVDPALTVLTQILRVSRNEDVVVAALESIQEMANEGWDVSGLANEFRDAIDMLRPRAGPIAALALDSLKKKLV